MKRTVLVTGAAGVLGRAVVAELAASGWPVVGIDRASAAELPDDVAFVGDVDLTDGEAVARAIADLSLDGLDGLVNIAGGFVWETLAEGSADTWEQLFRINLLTVVHSCRAALPLLRATEGAIVNIGAAASARAVAGMGAYTASKSGVERLTEALADEERPHGVRVNALLPSIIDTPANRRDMPEAEFSAWVHPRELAKPVAFLISDQASAITGVSIPVTGRW